MNRDEKFSDESLNAFVDNQLTAEEKSQMYTLINQDEALNGRVCELRKIRDLVQLAYADVPARRGTPPMDGKHKRFRFQAAAGFLLVLGTLLGWLFYQQPAAVRSPAAGDTQLNTVASAEGIKVLLHLNSGDPERMKETLDDAEELLEFYKKTKQVARVEIITNGKGVNLLRIGASPYAERIRKLYHEYSNLVFVACQNSIDRLQRELGITAQLLPEAVVIDSAVAQIMRRQQQGWAYIQV